MDLLERDAVLRDLHDHLHAAARGPGRLALVRGEAGIGKTAVIKRLTELVDRGTRVLVGAFDPLATPRPLGPMIDLAPQLGEAVRQAMAAALAGTDRHSEVIARLLADLGSRPGLLVIEDVHWADEATLDLLRYLARRLKGIPNLVVLTYRDEEIDRSHPLTAVLGTLAGCPEVYRYSLAPLTLQGVTRLAAESPVDTGQLYRITGGNPFFVTEVLAAPAGTIPATVREAVLGRIATLHRLRRR